jgi:elongation factor Tu
LEKVEGPTEAADGVFFMPMQDVFVSRFGDTVVTGRIERGKIRTGEEVEIVGYSGMRKPVIASIEQIGRQLNEARAGDNVGLVFRGIDKDEIKPGMVVAKSIQLSEKRSSK